MKEVTRDDIDGLRVDTRALSDSVTKLSERQHATDVVMGGKANATDVVSLEGVVLENRRLARRANINTLIGLVAIVLVLAYVQVQRNSDVQKAHSRRAADCRSMDDMGAAIKSGVTVLTTPRPGETDDQAQQIAAFVDSYNQAIDRSIDMAKTRKGYSSDCTVIGNPPKTGG